MTWKYHCAGVNTLINKFHSQLGQMLIASSVPAHAQSSPVCLAVYTGNEDALFFASSSFTSEAHHSVGCMWGKHLQQGNKSESQTTPTLTTPPPAFVFWVIGSVCGWCAGPWELLLSQHYLITASGSVHSDHQCQSRHEVKELLFQGLAIRFDLA